MDVPGGSGVDVRALFEHWEERNIAHYWEPYRRYIAELSLGEAFAHFGLRGDTRWIQRYFDVFASSAGLNCIPTWLRR
jgi:2-haloacid dehalogenase